MSSAPGPHTGIFREENAALRCLFGYAGNDLERPIPEVVLHCPKLESSTIKDVLFVSVDVDTFQGYEKISEGQKYHIGVTILDTRRLIDLYNTSTTDTWNTERIVKSTIKSYQYTIGRHRYTQRADRRFSFGASEAIDLSDIQAKFGTLVAQRRYVLVVHGGNEDAKFLENFGIVSSAAYIMDTVKAAQFILRLHYRYSLERLLEALQIEYRNLHAAGNDAHYALRALLMLTVKDAEQQRSTNSLVDDRLIRCLKRIEQTLAPGADSSTSGTTQVSHHGHQVPRH
ncbi:hypothetical protein ACRE_038380 [Hapsidospora chrysogenum ATCC 11550]|uniref:Gfd2/YDR514C-like C-terminal domain-containing protein n=1 Tax=Hapsidospora chrysogenum (strain ATCC 11550 / CBS 779.69 / DSM 880 / IAM 14645 / JCM 23072 / IMI 49137) TaxID=857340 RepID=A0A086T7M1_HAPC1|nr:hypothetical protein ACRE_038380 [Hapsidospora chrysogenum ATCC 11550]